MEWKLSKFLLIVCVVCTAVVTRTAAQSVIDPDDSPTNAVIQSNRAPNPNQQPPAGPALRLEDLERMALERNPTIAQATANIRIAEGRKIQASRYPNPTIGYAGDEIHPGPVIRGGEHGFFVQQTIVTGGKLSLNRDILGKEQAQAEAQAEAQQYRVLNAVRTLYYQALAAERQVELRQRLADLTSEAVFVSQQLFNVGQADRSDLLQADIESQQAQLELTTARNNRDRIWFQLAMVVGNPELKPSPLAGNLEALARDIDRNVALETILRESPEIKAARASIERAELAIKRAKVERIPDIDIRGGLRNNRELLELGGRPVGLEGFAEVGVKIPIFNRNQGNISAAQWELSRAQSELQRVELSLRSRFALAYAQYSTSRRMVEEYQKRILPQAEQAYQLYLTKYRQMAAAYPQVLISQRTMFQARVQYITALENLWNSVTQIRGLLLTGGLEASMILEGGQLEQGGGH